MCGTTEILNKLLWRTYNLRCVPPRRPPASRTKHTIHGAIVHPENPGKTYNSKDFAWLMLLSTTHAEASCRSIMAQSMHRIASKNYIAEKWSSVSRVQFNSYMFAFHGIATLRWCPLKIDQYVLDERWITNTVEMFELSEIDIRSNVSCN